MTEICYNFNHILFLSQIFITQIADIVSSIVLLED